ncbi:hypothetical protein [Porphyromonas gingivicanis]|uniref:hypothetical protein n=1 Tax=Porphyromonas gingivicanis TaxID=266762 RepID=UPI0011DDB4CE|nr:hypothetical protein [Porphyromonas gingivicanis]
MPKSKLLSDEHQTSFRPHHVIGCLASKQLDNYRLFYYICEHLSIWSRGDKLLLQPRFVIRFGFSKGRFGLHSIYIPLLAHSPSPRLLLPPQLHKKEGKKRIPLPSLSVSTAHSSPLTQERQQNKLPPLPNRTHHRPQFSLNESNLFGFGGTLKLLFYYTPI